MSLTRRVLIAVGPSASVLAREPSPTTDNVGRGPYERSFPTPKHLQFDCTDQSGQPSLVGGVSVLTPIVGMHLGLAYQVLGHLGFVESHSESAKKDCHSPVLQQLLDRLVVYCNLNNSHYGAILIVGYPTHNLDRTGWPFQSGQVSYKNCEDTTGPINTLGDDIALAVRFPKRSRIFARTP